MGNGLSGVAERATRTRGMRVSNKSRKYHDREVFHGATIFFLRRRTIALTVKEFSF